MCATKDHFLNQNINVAKEAESNLRKIEKCDVSLFINKQLILIFDDEFPGRKQILREFLL